MSGEQLLTVNGVDLCAETFGDQVDPVVLLISGAGSSMDFWDVDFCRQVAAAGRFVIRYDLRDTGRSQSYPPGRPTYTARDLVDDAVGILDAFRVESAHLAGISMGGALAQLLSLAHADRVASLTLLSTTAIGTGESDLPGPSPVLLEHFANPLPEPDWGDDAAVAEHLRADLRAYAGTIPVDDAAVGQLVRTVVARTRDAESSAKNHSLLPDDDSSAFDGVQASQIRVPTLILHGTADPLFPIAHGEALARAIPGAQLLALDEVGHEVPPRPVWPVVISAFIGHTAAAIRGTRP